MDRKSFLKNSLVATGSLLLGGAAIYRFLNDKEPAENPLPRTIEKIHQGDMKKILVIMSAGTKLGNTDRLTDAYIKGLVERGHSVTKVYLGSMRIEGCRGCGVCQRLARQCAVRDGMQDIYPCLLYTSNTQHHAGGHTDKDFRNSLGSLFLANRRSSYRKSHRYIYRMQESGKYPGNQQYGKVRGKHGYDIA